MDDRKKQTETFRNRESSFTVVRAVVAGYLVYLGFSLMRGTTDSSAQMVFLASVHRRRLAFCSIYMAPLAPVLKRAGTVRNG